jgi:hypothetical protein
VIENADRTDEPHMQEYHASSIDADSTAMMAARFCISR